MAGRNLFAEDTKPKGRNLFAEQPMQPAPDVPPATGQSPASQPAMEARQAADPSFVDRLNQEILNAPGGTALAEFGAAINRGAVNLADFFTTKPVRAAQQLAGVPEEERLSTLAETDLGQSATVGDYMEPGLARDVVQTSGELVAPGAVGGAAFRTAAQAIPKVQAGAQTLGQRLTQQMGGSTARQDVTGALTAGAGMELGGEAGEQVDIATGGTGETGRAVGSAVGAFGLPVGTAIAGKYAKDVSNLTTKSAKNLLKEATPTIEGLKEAARGVYKQIDDLGAVVNPSRVTRLGNELQSLAKREGFNRRIHPKVNAVLDEFEGVKGASQSVGELDTLRKVAQAAANSIEPSEKRLGTMIVGRIDDMLDDLKPKDFIKGGGEVGAKYRDARQLWNRAKKAEVLDTAFEKAKNQASGFENGIRTQFRSILNNKKLAGKFNQDELDAMRKVVRGGGLENIAKMLGRFGFSEGQASNMLMGSLGVAGGAAVGGSAGAVAVPLIGQVSKSLAQKLTRNNAAAAQRIVRAGKDANKILKAYVQSVPAKERSAENLTQLLLQRNANIDDIASMVRAAPAAEKKLISDSLFLVNAINAQEAQE